MQKKIDKLEPKGSQSELPLAFIRWPFDFHDFPKDMPLEESSEQGASHSGFSLFGPE